MFQFAREPVVDRIAPAPPSPAQPSPVTDAASISVRGLTKRFGPVLAVDGVDLDVAVGEFLALLGPSGSGKTTILMSIAGFDFPDAGSIHIGARDVTFLPPQRRELGMVFQRYTLFPHMSVAENVAFGLKMRGVGRAEREARALEALRTVRLETLGGRRPAQLSGGQQQRVALARAIVYRPQVLLMDEPLSALDKNLREEMQIEIKHLQQALQITVVFVTHDQTEALTMADRVSVLDRGRLQQVGSPRELYERPATAFVAGFIGETNFWPGVLAAGAAAGEVATVTLEGGERVQAVAAGALAAGRVRLAVRPERVRIDQSGVAGRVKEAIYVGNATTLIVGIAGTDVRVRLAAADPSCGAAAGMGVCLAWSADDARLYPA